MGGLKQAFVYDQAGRIIIEHPDATIRNIWSPAYANSLILSRQGDKAKCVFADAKGSTTALATYNSEEGTLNVMERFSYTPQGAATTWELKAAGGWQPHDGYVGLIAERPFAYLYAAGRYEWSSEIYTIGGTTYDAMTGRSLSPDYGEIRQLRYEWEHRDDSRIWKTICSPEVKGAIGAVMIASGAALTATGVGTVGGIALIVAGSGLVISAYSQESLENPDAWYAIHDPDTARWLGVVGNTMFAAGMSVALAPAAGWLAASAPWTVPAMVAGGGYLLQRDVRDIYQHWDEMDTIEAADRILPLAASLVGGTRWLPRGLAGLRPQLLRSLGRNLAEAALDERGSMTFWQPVRGQVGEASGEFRWFKSADALKRHLGPTGDDVVHHIVEQRAANIARFGEEAIHNTTNGVVVPGSVNQTIASYYSSKPASGFTRGLTIREWLDTQSWREQYEFGVDVLGRVRAAKPLA